jgi:glycosyltransferase involved in cell wall biosynthesis
MRVAIVHYHLQPGGVTRVIANALAALRGHPVQCLVLSAAAAAEEPGAPVAVVPGLAYRARATAAAGRALGHALAAAARAHFGGDPDLWHFHNHSLGRNVALPGAIAVLRAAGAALLLQVHDFAEDGRPANYRAQRALADPLYPQGGRVHYALLNDRDRRLLQAAGMPAARLHLLPNPVALPDADAAGEPAPPPLAAAFARPPATFYLYPTRAIRRKNVGELLLLAAAAPSGSGFATTLAPQNPVWQAIHQQWVDFARSARLPVAFAVGDLPGARFQDWIHAATALVTTSVAEGFGLAFLEPWLFGKAVLGRDLPAITADFNAAGIDLGGLYGTLPVPLAWIGGAAALQAALQPALATAYRAYGRELPAAAAAQAAAAVVNADMVDFGALDENLQRRVLQRVLELPPERRPHRQALQNLPAAPVIAANRAAIAGYYGLDRYGERLAALYRAIATAPDSDEPPLPGASVLDQFLAPASFRLLRS